MMMKKQMQSWVWGMAILPAAIGQTLAQTPSGGATDLDKIVVTGIRGSLESSLNLKRDATGVVDGIIAEDIGKFPDTNLAESLQRISGVSIDRTLSGEGSKVTVRGIGADFNLVLLNGRQMPTANFLYTEGYGFSNSRAFDFANLASEAVSELEVYKTSHADAPTGGIGATINIKTARPLDRPGLHANLSVKGVMDKSVDNLPRTFPGDSITPEVSGIFSNTWGDGRFGIAASGSYQVRDSAFSQVRVNQGWRALRGDDSETWYRLPFPGEPGYDEVINRPGPEDVYARPQNFMYLVSSSQRRRRNGQVAFQYAPTDTLRATLDYTYADNSQHQQRSELLVDFGFRPGASSWTDGPVAAPIEYRENNPAGTADVDMVVAQMATLSEMKSVGLNLEWRVSDVLDFSVDYHDSRTELKPDGPLGSGNWITSTAFVRGDTYVDFSNAFPIFHMDLRPGVAQVEPAHMQLNGRGFVNGFSRTEVKQGQASGTFRFWDYQALDFGLARTEVFNFAAQVGSAGIPANGFGTPDDYADDIWYSDDMMKYFKRFPGHDDPRMTGRFLVFDFDRLRARGIEVTGVEEGFKPRDTTTSDRRLYEKTSSAYMQWRGQFEWGVPVAVSLGVRHERTEVASPVEIRPPLGNLTWISTNEMQVDTQDEPVMETFTGKYDNWLPSIDLRAELRENLVARVSYGKSIGRAGWSDLKGGMSLGRIQRFGGVGSRGNSGLLPLESKNLDLSLEWYYAPGSYAAVGYFRKDIKNFIGSVITRETPYPIATPIGGTYWNNAIALGGCSDTDITCIRNYIFRNHAGDPGVNHTGQDGGGNESGTITGQPGDPIAEFDITTPANQRSDTLDGIELNMQHMFGDSGFGIAANYTKVDSGLTFDNARLDEQYPMVGLSDSANVVLFYEKHGWQIRAAYNWRDEFLSAIGGNGGPNPWYTEKYGQLDMNVTWEKNQHLAFFVEAINLTDETQRVYDRHKNMVKSASQTGVRYMFGVRYKF